MESAVIRIKYMDFFALWGYAMIYISGFVFKTEYDRHAIELQLEAEYQKERAESLGANRESELPPLSSPEAQKIIQAKLQQRSGTKITEANLYANSMILTLAGCLYGTGILKIFGVGNFLPRWQTYFAVMATQALFMPHVIYLMSR